MTEKEAMDIINLNRNATNEEEIEAYKKFFEMFGVSLQNDDGTYKSMYDVFNEAHNWKE